MADPTIQTFCCHRSPPVIRSNLSGGAAVADFRSAELLLEQFHSAEYNAVCLACAAVGIIGAVYQILPRRHSQTRTLQMCRGREIITWLAAADLMSSIGVFVRSAVWLLLGNSLAERTGYESVIFCALSSAWTQYFYTCTWLWTLSYAVDVRRSLQGIPPCRLWTHALCWLVPALLTMIGSGALYLPDAQCQHPDSAWRILPAFCVTYLPILVVMVANPWLYFLSSKDVLTILTLSSGQVTNKERSSANTITFKFFVINVSFYACWLPNLLNGFLLAVSWWKLFELPPAAVLALWYVMAVTNPLQAAFNALVYRQRRDPTTLKFPSFCCINDRPDRDHDDGDIDDVSANESTPLMETYDTRERPYWSLNHSCSYL